MALVIGTNCGFVTEAPTEDPEGQFTDVIDYQSFTIGDTSPVGAGKIVEIGFWCNEATEESNFEVGLYAPDGDFDYWPGTRLYTNILNAKGTTSGWKSAIVDWEITGNTKYWIAVQLDDTTTETTGERAISGGQGYVRDSSETYLKNPWDALTSNDSDGMWSIYAIWEAAPVGTNMKINISDVFKDIESLKTNIGDAWKNVIKVQQNIGDVWKNVFG